MTTHATTLRPLLAACAACAAVSAAGPAWAAGPWLSETGGADIGLAGAGRAALSLDAAVLSANPAGLAGLHDTTVTAAVMPLDLETDFSGTAGGVPAHATNESGPVVLPALYATRRAGDFAFGLGAYSDLGLGFDLGNAWAGRRDVEQAELATYTLAAAAAWQIDERWAVGASIGAQWAEASTRVAVANDAAYYGPPVGLPDGQLRVSGDSWGFDAQLGVTYQATPATRLGLAWSAPVNHEIDADVTANNVHPVLATLLPPPGSTRITFEAPQQVLAGASHALSPATTLAAGVSWQDWSKFGEARLRLPGQGTPLFPAGLEDTWGLSVGVRHAVDDRWTLATGIDYESDPAGDGGVPAYMPVAAQWRLALGAERELGDSCRVRTALSVVLQDDADVQMPTHPLPLPGIPPLYGRYENTTVYLLSLAADFRL